MTRNHPAIAAAFGSLALVLSVARAGAGGDKVAFPEQYTQGVLYASQDMADVKEFRELYITPAALAAVRKGDPLPSGTVVTLARYNVVLDAGGNPVKDTGGRYIKTSLKAYRVMEKRTGWGTAYPAGKRNGEWEYQAFLPNRAVDATVNLDSCFQCHLNGDSTNFMFTADALKAAASALH